MPGLSIFPRPALTTADQLLHFDASYYIWPTWRRKSNRIGGYFSGSFDVSSERAKRDELAWWYDHWLGCRLAETTYGKVSWEGIIWQMDLILDGVNYRRTLNPKKWHNYVKVVFSSEDVMRDETDWSENTDASAEFGRMDLLLYQRGCTATSADDLRDRHLTEFAWPRSRMVGGITLDPDKGKAVDQLKVKVKGFWDTLFWRYRLCPLIPANADTQIDTLVGNSEFVTAGRTETNAMQARVEAHPNPRRIGEFIEDIIEQGDGSGNFWQGGVYAGREFVYEQAPTTVTHYLQGGVLMDQAGQPVIPTLLEPGFLLQNANAPTGGQPPGTSGVWDDPRVAYVDEVEFIAPSTLKLKLKDEEESIITLTKQLAAGAFVW